MGGRQAGRRSGVYVLCLFALSLVVSESVCIVFPVAVEWLHHLCMFPG